MKLWIIATIMISLLMVAGFAARNFVAAKETSNSQENGKDSTGKISCESCGSSCSAEKNCGLASCGAVSGSKCGCGK